MFHAKRLFDFSIFPVLVTARLCLRRLTAGDADSILELYGDPEVARFVCIEPPCDTRERALQEVDDLRRVFDERQGLVWGMTLRDAEKVIGTCCWYNWSQAHRQVVVGYDLQRAYWGRGLMTEALDAVMAWCFTHLDVHRIQADCTEGNRASERVLEKLGFTLEGVWRENCYEHGRFVNSKQYGVLRHEYPNRPFSDLALGQRK